MCIRKESIDEVTCFHFHKTRGSAISTSEPLTIDNVLIDNERDTTIRIIYQTKNCCCADQCTQSFEKHFAGCERDPRDAQCGTEITRNERFVARSDIQI